MSNWPPRLTMTLDGAIRLILLNYETEGNAGKTELAMLAVIRDAYEQGYRHGKSGEPMHTFERAHVQTSTTPEK